MAFLSYVIFGISSKCIYSTLFNATLLTLRNTKYILRCRFVVGIRGWLSMAKRKRAKGAGAKPKGEFSGLTSPLSFRMPAAMRRELEQARRKSGRSTTQEVLTRLKYSFNEDRRKARDPALQAVCYLIGEAAEGITNPAPVRVKNLRPLWRSDPFLFRAFKLAVAKLLDALEPAGEIKPPRSGFEIADGTRILAASKILRDIYQTPETLGNFVAAGILRALLSPVPVESWGWPRPRWEDYGMEPACRDLGLKPKGRKS